MGSKWYLENIDETAGDLNIPLEPLPFYVGRGEACELVIPSWDISRRHASLDTDGRDGITLQDLGSTNGSFVNGKRITDSLPVLAGDVIHFGTAGFRLKCHRRGSERITSLQELAATHTRTVISRAFPVQEHEFQELMQEKLIGAALQPIVTFDDHRIVAYEVLGRGRHPNLPIYPIPLFVLAEAMGQEVELSRAFRLEGALVARGRDVRAALYLNSHPRELFTRGLYLSLEHLRTLIPQAPLTLEVDAALAGDERMPEMGRQLDELGIRLAYVGVGAGLQGIGDIGHVPPDVAKFDVNLIRSIDMASAARVRAVGDMVRAVLDLGSLPLAEGVETAAEARLCQDLGFRLCQGRFTGEPVMD